MVLHFVILKKTMQQKTAKKYISTSLKKKNPQQQEKNSIHFLMQCSKNISEKWKSKNHYLFFFFFCISAVHFLLVGWLLFSSSELI